ncbi:outer membrane beta-barrel protein [Mucilaginibacter ginkgonis]|uniref:outer membrane beta-barrel protein n=1 Tax=Mucilaginibacter ginkgonis TaxID=2682091 RepID=UPI001FC7CF86|nr:outer membrane beta-barrel protein [Mucilaginibacter ginkgonis]
MKLGGGLAYQQIDNPDVVGVNTVGSFSFGGLATYALPQHLELQGGVTVSRKGAIIVEDAVTTTQRVTSVDLPLTIVRNIDAGRLGYVYIGPGIYYSRHIGGNVYYQTPSSATSDKLEFGPDLDLRRDDFGLDFTTGIRLRNNLLFDVSYQFGLRNIASTRFTDTGTDAIKSRMFTVSLGYFIR